VSGTSTRAYLSSLGVTRLHQGEILSNVVERLVKWTPDAEGGDDFGFAEVVHPYVVVLAQDCDLEQDANGRATRGLDESKLRNALISNVLLIVASEFENAKSLFPGSDVRKRAKQNKDERFHFLSAVPAADDALTFGIPSMVLDFKRFFTYPTEELLNSISRGEARQRARLSSPYVEHLSSRFGYFIQRVGLPQDHHNFETQSAQLPGAELIPLLVESGNK
jgi:hypothetical protein